MSAIGLTGTLLSAVTPSASAFDCNGAKRCPYVKVENRDKDNVTYEVWAHIYSTNTPQEHLYSWHERRTEYALWHWRWYGGDEWHIKIRIETTGYGGHFDRSFDVPASDSVCLAVDRAGPYQTTGCTDAEDPARGATG